MATRAQPATAYKHALQSIGHHRPSRPSSVAGPSSRPWTPSSRRTFTSSPSHRSAPPEIAQPPPPPPSPPPPSLSPSAGTRLAPPPPPPSLDGRPAMFAHSRETPDYPVYYSSQPHVSRSPTPPPPLRKRPSAPPPPLLKSVPRKPPPKPRTPFEEPSVEYSEAEHALPDPSELVRIGQGEHADGIEPVQDPRRLPCATLAQAVRAGEWSEARRQLSLLHDKGAGALESHIYVGAAVDSLTTDELETEEERLEWFLHWYSLVPTFTGKEGTYRTAVFVQQNARLADLLLQFPNQLAYLARILVLFAEKRYAGFFGPLLVPHLAVFGPPDETINVWAAICDASGWSASDANRHTLANVIVSDLVRSGHWHEAAEAIVRVRATCVPRSVVSRNGLAFSRPPLDLETIVLFKREVRLLWGTKHAYVLAADEWSQADYPLGSREAPESPVLSPYGLNRRNNSWLPDRAVERIPNRAELPAAIRRLLLPGPPPSVHSVTRVLHAVYALNPPRMNLLGLLHRRISGITEVGLDDGKKASEHDWVAAEMLRLQQLDNPVEAVRLFASRYLWAGLPTSPRWDEYRRMQTSTQEDVGLSEELIGHALTGIRRKMIPPPHLIALAMEAITSIDYWSGEVEWLEEDYRSMIANSRPRDPERASPQTIDSTPRIPLDQLLSDPNHLSLAISPPHSTSSSAEVAHPHPSSDSPGPGTVLTLATSPATVRLTPWTSPSMDFFLPPALLPTRRAFHHWVRYFARIDPTKAMAILREMVDRKIHSDSIDWLVVLEGFVDRDMTEFAITGLQTMEREGGILVHRPDRVRVHSSVLGPFEPLADDEDPNEMAPAPEGAQPYRRAKPVPPTYGDIYVSLIARAQRGSVRRGRPHVQGPNPGSTDVSRLFEEMMANSGVVLTEKNKLMMVRTYALRGRMESRQSENEGREAIPPEMWERSPWGHPVCPATEWDDFGHEVGEREKTEMVAGWAMTAVDDGMPIESRLRQMLDENKRAARRRALWILRGQAARQSGTYGLAEPLSAELNRPKETLAVEWSVSIALPTSPPSRH